MEPSKLLHAADHLPEIQAAKQVVRDHHAALAQTTVAGIQPALASHMGADVLWRGMHPFHELNGLDALADTFWTPLLTALSPIQRRADVFIAGKNDCDEGKSCWVTSMGHLMGLFDAPFLGIAPTGRIAMLRFAEFNKVEDGRITEQAFFCDLMHLMAQAGQYPLPQMTGAQLVQPGPMTHDGLLYDPQDPAEGAKTLARISAMMQAITEANAGKPLTPRQELQQDWHDDMLWWGPTGIGATYTIDRYIQQHQQPFRRELSNRVFNGHVARLTEGNYGAFFGWPNLTLECTGPYLGLPATGKKADMRVVDVYRRDGDKLAENWVFIDLPHFLNQQGLDVFSRNKTTRHP